MAEKRTSQNWHLMRELLHSGTQSTQSLRDSGSQIDTPSHNVENCTDTQIPRQSKVGRDNNVMTGRQVVLGGVFTNVSSAGFSINEKLALPGAVLD